MARLPTTTDVYNAIAEPQRRDIIDLLKKGEMAVNDIAEALEMKQPQTSKLYVRRSQLHLRQPRLY